MAKIFVCGDICNHTPGVGFIDDSISKKISSADYAVCNFEGPELKEGQTATCPHQEPGTAEYLKANGFDLMLLANNHITELEGEGVKYSIDTIHSAGADCIGASLSWDEAYTPLIKEIKGKRYGFINVCEAQVGQYLTKDQPYGYAWMGYEGLMDDIENLSNQTDYVIVFVHAGLEHYPIPLPEIRSFYKKLCDAGASAVVGGHPHAAQGYEYYNGKPIVYSLGNFFFPYTDGRNLSEYTSYSVELNFDDDGTVIVTPVHHRLENGVVKLVDNPSEQIDVNALCQMLKDGYDAQAEKMCVTAYRKLCSHLLAEATCGEYEGISTKRRLKQKIRQVFQHGSYVVATQKRRDALMLRLFENETYHWTIVRALKNKNK